MTSVYPIEDTLRLGIFPLQGGIYTPQFYMGGTNVVVVADRLYSQPLWVPNRVYVTQAGLSVSTLASASTARMGIYQDVGGIPVNLVSDLGEVSTASTGTKRTAPASPVLLIPGIYWIASLFSSTPTIVGIAATTAILPLLGYTANNETTVRTGLIATQSYGALPSTYPSVSLSTTTTPRVEVEL